MYPRLEARAQTLRLWDSRPRPSSCRRAVCGRALPASTRRAPSSARRSRPASGRARTSSTGWSSRWSSRPSRSCALLLDESCALPEIGGPVGISGGVTAIGVRLALVEPRIAAAGLFAGSFVPRAIIEEARRVTVPLHVLLQWDDRGNDRQTALDLFDAFGSTEKTLQANMGGHTGIPPVRCRGRRSLLRPPPGLTNQGLPGNCLGGLGPRGLEPVSPPARRFCETFALILRRPRGGAGGNRTRVLERRSRSSPGAVGVVAFLGPGARTDTSPTGPVRKSPDHPS